MSSSLSLSARWDMAGFACYCCRVQQAGSGPQENTSDSAEGARATVGPLFPNLTTLRPAACWLLLLPPLLPAATCAAEPRAAACFSDSL